MKKVVVIFGGISTEHGVSVISAKSVIKNIDKEKYIVSGVYIDKDDVGIKLILIKSMNLTFQKVS